MKLSISNIAWSDVQDDEMYKILHEAKFEGLEIAPTRFEPDNPYTNTASSVQKAKYLKEEYNLQISSMQSIWFGRKERIFATSEERNILIEYTKKAIQYASLIGCRNLVFGSPVNRTMEDPQMLDVAIDFFYKIGENAKENGVIIAFEPNPVIYNTNFINSTSEAFDFVKKVNSKGLLVNLDLGTVIWNNENINEIMENISLINHIHISEPYLEKITPRDIHRDLSKLLRDNQYDKFVSIEMKKQEDTKDIKESIDYIIEVMRGYMKV